MLEESHLLEYFLSHMAVFFFLLNCFVDFLEGYLPYLIFLFLFYTKIHSSATEIWLKLKQIPVFFMLWILLGNRFELEGFLHGSIVRWCTSLCWEKSILPESIVKRCTIIRQLVVWWKEMPCTGNSHSSLFLEEKRSSPETWIHWKLRLNKTEHRKSRKAAAKGPCQRSHPIFVFGILKGI